MPETVVLGVDFGRRRLGLAIGNTITGSARPLETVQAAENPVAAVRPTIRTWRPDRIIVGLPLAADGSETETSRAARRFADELRAAFPHLALSLHDERYSSIAAEQRFAEARKDGRARRRDAGRLDAMAAAVIVERWLTEHVGATA